MKLFIRITAPICFILLVACQQQDMVTEKKTTYSDSIYDLKTYLVERHPTVVRNGFGLDIFHEGNASLDTLYLSNEKLPPYHPNNPVGTGAILKRYNKAAGDSVAFQYDLLFYNEFAYNLLSTGDYSATGYPVIFMYTDPTNESNSTKATMIGQGINCFHAFTTDSIAKYKSGLKSDPLIDLASYRTPVNTATVSGSILLEPTVDPLISKLVIGYKFRPKTGGIFNMPDASDVAQINYQPVFLIKTREGLYAKFMVTRFKGVGVDTQKLTLQWQALK